MGKRKLTKQKRNGKKRIVLFVLLALIGIVLFMNFSNNSLLKGVEEVSVPVLTNEETMLLKKYNNTYHIEVAKKKGLSRALESGHELNDGASDMSDDLGLVKIVDNKYYEIPALTNSLPYLQPEAKIFLKKLGRRFTERLSNEGIVPYRYSVTSILRTLESQKKLRLKNVNATNNTSSHYYGRTFDISQTRFFERGNSTPIYSYRLRNILLRELLKMQDEGLCYVILESQTKCIHVTVR